MSEELKVIKEVEKGLKKKTHIIIVFGRISPNILSMILKNKDKITQAVKQNYIVPVNERLRVALLGLEEGVLMYSVNFKIQQKFYQMYMKAIAQLMCSNTDIVL